MDRIVLAPAIAVAGAAAGAQLAGAYVGSGAFWAIIAAAGGAALIGLLAGGHRAWHPPASAAGLVVLVTVLHRMLPAPGGLLDALSHAGARLLSSATPFPSRMDTIALPVAATWIAVAVSCALTYGRRPAAAVIPPVVLAVAMLIVAGPQPSPGYPQTAILVAALAIVFAVARAPHAVSVTTRGALRMARLGSAALLAAALATASGLVTPLLLIGLTQQPPDLRSVVLAPVQAPAQVHPLSLLGRWSAHPDQLLLRVDSDRPVVLRWAVLADFDGASWQPAQAYRAAGGDRDPSTPAGVPVEDVHAKVTVIGLAGAWLPVPDGLRRVSGVAIAVDQQSGSVVVPDGLRAGQSYEVHAAVPVPQPAQLATAQLPASADLDRYRQLPAGNTGRIPELAIAAAGDGLPYAQATALARWLKENYRFDPLAPGGSGYPSINRFLTATPATGGGRGTSEQFAAAYAVLARAIGIPARVVVGFPLRPGTGDQPTITVTAGDARAWPEIYLEPVGWIPIDVTAPAATSAPAATPSPRPSLTGVPPTGQPSQPDASTLPDVSIAIPQPDGQQDRATSWWRLGWLAALVPVLIGLVVLLRMRRSRRRLADPDELSRVRGAWAELLDGARLAGIRLPAHWTVTEVVAAVSEAVAVAPDSHLVDAVNRAGFAAEPDSDGTALAVAQATDLVGRARQGTGRLRRAVWWLDPRPLWW